MHVLVTCKYKNNRIKTTEKRWRHRLPHYKSVGAFCCNGNQSFNPICPKTLCSLSPTPVMLHIKFDQDWPTGFRDIQVWNVDDDDDGRRTTDDDGRTTDDDGRTTDHWYTITHLVSLRLRWAKNWNAWRCTSIRHAKCVSCNVID